MERDDAIGEAFDAANDVDERSDTAYEEWRQRADEEREEVLEKALDECKALGVSRDSLKTLVFETGATRWGLQQSLKLPEPVRKGGWPID